VATGNALSDLLRSARDELAGIMRHAREIGQAIDDQIGSEKP